MAILEIAVRYEGTQPELNRAVGQLTKVFGGHAFLQLTPLTPMTIMITDEQVSNREVADLEQLLNREVRSLPLQSVVYNTLARVSIYKVRDAMEKTAAELLAIPNFGPARLRELERALAQIGLQLQS